MKMMKQILGALLVTFLVAGCSKSNDAGTTSTYFMQAKVDGTLYKSDLSTQASLSSNVLSLAGRWNSGGGFTFAIPNYTGPATYNLGSGNFSTAVLTLGTTANDSYVSSVVSGAGSIVVTSLANNVVKGTFSFTGRNNAGTNKQVTEGQFELKLQ